MREYNGIRDCCEVLKKNAAQICDGVL